MVETLSPTGTTATDIFDCHDQCRNSFGMILANARPTCCLYNYTSNICRAWIKMANNPTGQVGNPSGHTDLAWVQDPESNNFMPLDYDSDLTAKTLSDEDKLICSDASTNSNIQIETSQMFFEGQLYSQDIVIGACEWKYDPSNRITVSADGSLTININDRQSTTKIPISIECFDTVAIEWYNNANWLQNEKRSAVFTDTLNLRDISQFTYQATENWAKLVKEVPYNDGVTENIILTFPNKEVNGVPCNNLQFGVQYSQACFCDGTDSTKKCADAGGACSCSQGNTVYFGHLDQSGNLDTSRSYKTQVVESIKFLDTFRSCGYTFQLANCQCDGADCSDCSLLELDSTFNNYDENQMQLTLKASAPGGIYHFNLTSTMTPYNQTAQVSKTIGPIEINKKIAMGVIGDINATICVDSTQQTIRYGYATSHFEKYTGDLMNIGNCRMESNSASSSTVNTPFIDSNGVLIITQDISSKIRTYAVTITCFDLDDSTSPQTQASKDFQVTVVNVDVLQSSIFDSDVYRYFQLTGSTDESLIPKLYFQGLVQDSTTQDIMDKCILEFTAQVSETDETWPPDFQGPKDLHDSGGNLELKGTSDHLIKPQQYQFWIKQKALVYDCACIGIVKGWNDGTMRDNGYGSYCYDDWDVNPSWCYVSPNLQCYGSTPTTYAGWQNKLSWIWCPQISNNQAIVQKQVESLRGPFTLHTFTSCKDGIIEESPINTNQKVDAGSQQAFFKLEQFFCDSIVNNVGDGIRYSFTFLDHNHATPLTQEQIDNIKQFQYFPRAYVQAQPKLEFSENRFTLEQCKEVCLNDPECLAFEYGVDYGSQESQNEVQAPTKLEKGKQYRFYVDDNGTTKVLASTGHPFYRNVLGLREKGYINNIGVDVYNSEVFEVVDAMDGDPDSISLKSLADCQNFNNECDRQMCCDYYESRESSRGDFYIGVSVDTNSYFYSKSLATFQNQQQKKKLSFKVYYNEDQNIGLTTIQLSPNSRNDFFMTVDGFDRFWFEAHGEKTYFSEGDCNIKTKSSPIIQDWTGSKNLDLYIVDQSQKWIYADQQTGLVTKSPLDTTIVKAYQVYIYIEDAARPDPNFKFIGPFILNVTCDNNQIIPSSVSQNLVFDATLGYLINQNDFSSEQGLFELYFQNFTTSNQYCPISKYNILESLESVVAHPNLTAPQFTTKGMNVKINTTECKTFQFWIHTQDNYGNQAFSNKVKVSVICPEQVFTQAIMIASDITAARTKFQVGEPGLLLIDHFREAKFGFKAQNYILTTDLESTTPNLQSPGCQQFMTSNVPGNEQSNGQIGFQIDTSLLQSPCRVRIFGYSLIDPSIYAFTKSTSIQVTCGSEKIQVDSSISNPEQLLFELGAKIPQSLSPYNLVNHWKIENPVFTTSSQYCPIIDFILDPSCSPGVRAKMSKVTVSQTFPQTLEFDTSQAYNETICIKARTEKVIGQQAFVIQIYVGSLDQFNNNISQSEQQEQYFNASMDGMKLQILFSTEIVTYKTVEKQEEVLSRILDIKSISGLDESLNYNGNFTFSDSNARKLSIETQQSDDLDNSLAFEWSLANYTSKKLEISLKFSDQDQISANPLVYDKLQIQFKKDMIVDLSTFVSYPEESYESFTMEIIPKPLEEDQDLADSLVEVTTNIAAGVLGASFLLGFSNVQLMKQLWQLLSNVYLGLLLSVIVLNLPLNARAFIDSLSQIHQISVFQSQFQLYEKLDISKTHYKSLGYAKLGFQSLNFIQNVEAMFVKLIGFLACLVLVKLLMIAAVRYYRKSFCLKIGAIANKKQILTILMQMTFKFIQTFCMPIFLCSLHQLDQLKSNELTKADKFSIFLAMFSVCCLVFLQIYILSLVKKYRKKLSSFAFQKKYEFIFQKQRTLSVSQAIFPSLQMIRQMIQSCILFYMDKQVTVAIHLSLLLTLYMLGYILTVNPFETKKQQLIMIFNETSIYLITILYLSFISSFRQERSLGFVFIVFFLSNFGINLILLVIEGSKKIPQSIQKIVTKVQDLTFKVKRELWLKNLGKKALDNPNDNKIQEEYMAASKVVKDAKLKEKMEKDLKDFDAKMMFLCHNQLPVKFLERKKSNSLIIMTRSLSYNPLFDTGVKSMDFMKDSDNGKHTVMFDQFYKSEFDQRLYEEMYDLYLYKNKIKSQEFAPQLEKRQTKSLGKMLEEQGFYFVRIEKDGNCGPRCVSVRLYGHKDFHLKIRTETNTFMDEVKFKKIKGDESLIGQWLTPKQFKKLKAFRKRQYQMWSPDTCWTHREIRSAALLYDIPIICFSVKHGSTGFDRLYPARTEEGSQREILYMFHHDNHFTVLLHPSQLKLMLFIEKKGLAVKKFEFKTYRQEDVNKILLVDQILEKVETKFQDQAEDEKPSQDKKQENAKEERSDLIAQPTREQKVKSKLQKMKQKVVKTKASIKRDKSKDLHEITEVSEEQFQTDRKDLKSKRKNKEIQDGSIEFEDEPNPKANKIKKKSEKSKDTPKIDKKKVRSPKKDKKSKSKYKIPGKWQKVRDELDKHLGIEKKLRKKEKKMRKKRELLKSSSSSSFEEKYFDPMAVRYPDDYFQGDNNAKQDFLAEHAKYLDRLYEHMDREGKRINRRLLKDQYLNKKLQSSSNSKNNLQLLSHPTSQTAMDNQRIANYLEEIEQKLKK